MTTRKATVEMRKRALYEEAARADAPFKEELGILEPRLSEVNFSPEENHSIFNPRDIVDSRGRLPFIISTMWRINPIYPKNGPITKINGQDPRGRSFHGTALRQGKPEPTPQPIIALTIAPNSVGVNQGTRSAESKNRAGAVKYTWPDARRRSYFDEPTVTYQFQSGNILPWTYIAGLLKQRAVTSADYDKANRPVPKGLADFYEFLAILDEDPILPDGRPNFVVCIHTSRIWPRLVLVGFFSEQGVNVEDKAEDPNQVNWSAQFMCRYTVPHLSDSGALLRVYREMDLPIAGALPISITNR